jgi:hypothetical protein
MASVRSCLLGLAAFIVIALPVTPQNGAVVAGSSPGKVGVGQTVDITATITAIDKATRDVTLKGPQGNEVTVTAGPEVKNFGKLKVGDQVMAKYAEALTLQLMKSDGSQKAEPSRTEDVAGGRAKSDAPPGAAIGRQVTIIADVIGLDPATQTVTLKGPQRTVDMVVRDPEQFRAISKGDQVKATYTQAFALAVAPVKK